MTPLETLKAFQEQVRDMERALRHFHGPYPRPAMDGLQALQALSAAVGRIEARLTMEPVWLTLDNVHAQCRRLEASLMQPVFADRDLPGHPERFVIRIRELSGKPFTFSYVQAITAYLLENYGHE